MKHFNLLRWGVACLMFTVFLFSSCKKDDDKGPSQSLTSDFSAEVATEWMGLLLKLSKENPGFTPPVAARAFGFTGLAFYESVRAGMPGYKSMQGQVNGLAAGTIPTAENKEYHWGAVANAAIATIAKACYSNATPANATAMDDLEAQLLNDHFKNEATQEVLDRSIAYGKSVGDAMVSYAAADGQANCFATNFPESYVPPVGDGLWVPTPPAFQRALQPYWGDVRPFLTKNVADALPPPYPTYSTDPASVFWTEVMEVYTTVQALTPEQKLIAEFWSDDPGKTATPPGHSIAILKQILEDENADLAVAAEAFAKLGMGVHDAFISCWHAKYIYNLIRPITIIQDKIDPGFSTVLTTPPFPEYPSGHSVQSGATAEILTSLFGPNYAFTDRTHADRTDIDGTPRTFSSFDAFAEEAAISRLYGGIHFRAAIVEGVKQGREVGKNISTLDFN